MRSKKIEATEKAIGGRVWWDIFERICKVVLWPKHFKDYRHTPVYLCREVPSFQERFCVCSASELKVMALEFSGRAAKMRRKLRKLCFILRLSKCSDSNPIAKAMPPGIFDKALIPAFLDCLIHCWFLEKSRTVALEPELFFSQR